jgi:CspA family cold shock protein
MAERETGTVKWFSPQNGYGFITRDEGGDIFVHYSAIRGKGQRRLEAGQRVEYTVVQGDRTPRVADAMVIS